MRQGRYGEALEAFGSALEIDPELAEAHVGRDNALFNSGPAFSSNPVGGRGGRWRQQLDHRPKCFSGRVSIRPKMRKLPRSIPRGRRPSGTEQAMPPPRREQSRAPSSVRESSMCSCSAYPSQGIRNWRYGLASVDMGHAGPALQVTEHPARQEARWDFNGRIDRDFLRLCPATASDWRHACLTSP